MCVTHHVWHFHKQAERTYKTFFSQVAACSLEQKLMNCNFLDKNCLTEKQICSIFLVTYAILAPCVMSCVVSISLIFCINHLSEICHGYAVIKASFVIHKLILVSTDPFRGANTRSGTFPSFYGCITLLLYFCQLKTGNCWCVETHLTFHKIYGW
jgi:hypothetical protein